jgi:hypothetical protein
MYPSVFFANAAGADGGAAGAVIQEEEQQVVSSATVSIKLNCVNKQSQTAIHSIW